jgi:hypothetical protein
MKKPFSSQDFLTKVKECINISALSLLNFLYLIAVSGITEDGVSLMDLISDML